MNRAICRTRKSQNHVVLSRIAKKEEEAAEFPMRNYLCGHYDDCLDSAAFANTLFNCDSCRQFAPAEKRELSTVELRGIMMLWKSVFDMAVSIH